MDENQIVFLAFFLNLPFKDSFEPFFMFYIKPTQEADKAFSLIIFHLGSSLIGSSETALHITIVLSFT